MGQKASGQEDSWLLGQLSEGRMEQGEGRAGPGAVQEGGASEGPRPAAAAGLGSWATLPPAQDRLLVVGSRQEALSSKRPLPSASVGGGGDKVCHPALWVGKWDS